MIHPEIVGDCGVGRKGACIFRPAMATPAVLGMQKNYKNFIDTGRNQFAFENILDIIATT
ncbi:hypothetical protein [Janthinobacterium lividum]|uniref:hypothetical protein n=1 Tax=Janthinobacterium lividum TaxID=29581 RepID=UPI0011131E3F|nr:hypothetical protein [Janthinobacterium lividum]MCC7712425.1 hypothetical protein [Janthinobacterium lividum]WQE26904.1 hypothetical protein U0004_18070 [Janthinobacterium lividum]